MVPDGEKAIERASSNFEKAAEMDKDNVWSLTYGGFLWGYLGKIAKAKVVDPDTVLDSFSWRHPLA